MHLSVLHTGTARTCLARAGYGFPDIPVDFTILESLSGTDFYDFYALQHASTDELFRHDAEVRRRADDQADYVRNQLVDELSTIVVSRFANHHIPATRDWMVKHRIPMSTIENSDQLTTYEEEISKIPLTDRMLAIEDVVRNKIHGYMASHTWWGIATTVLAAYRATGRNETVFAVDRLFNMLHHGGQITDYMKEKWLSRALNFRDNASIAQVLAKSSSDVRSLVGRATHGAPKGMEISEIRMLATAVRRASGGHPDVKVVVGGGGFNMIIIAPAILYAPVVAGKAIPSFSKVWFYAGGPQNGHISDRETRVVCSGVGKVKVTDGSDRIYAIDQHRNRFEVSKPIGDFYGAANALLTMSLAAIDPLLAKRYHSGVLGKVKI